MGDYVMAPTPAQCVEHIEKGGVVEQQSTHGGTWGNGCFNADDWRDLPNEDSPRHACRLVPIPPRTVTVEIPEDDARAWAGECGPPPGSGRRLAEACSKALGED